MFSSYIRELTWSPGHSFVLRYVLLESLPVRGSFAVQFGDHFPSGDHLRAGPVQILESVKLLFDPFYVERINKQMGILVALIAVVIRINIPPRSKLSYKDVFFPLHFHLGWGKIKHPGSSHNILQQAQMPPVTNSECARKLAASPGTRLKSFFFCF